MEIIQIIIKSLNQIEVKGAENLDRMLGCIQGLERLDTALEGTKNDYNNEQKQEVSAQVD